MGEPAYDYDFDELENLISLEELDDLPVFLAYQAKWLEDESPVKICNKSRRIGISWVTAFEAVLTAAARRSAGGSDVFYMSQSIRDSKEFTLACGVFARELDIAYQQEANVKFILEDGERSIRVTQITFASGYRIVILPGTRPDALRGKQGLAIFDEAKLLNIPDCLAAAEAFQMWGGRLIFISTQGTEDNGFNTELLAKAEERRWSVHTYTIHDAVNDGLYKRICLVTGKEWSAESETEWVSNLLRSPRAAQEYLCIPGGVDGLYLPRSLVESRARKCPIARLRLPAKWELKPVQERKVIIDAWIDATLLPIIKELDAEKIHAWGMDFGRSPDGDLSVFYAMRVEPDLKRTTVFTIEMTGVPFDEQERIVFLAADNLPRSIGGKIDKSGNGASLAEHATQRYGELVVEGVQFSEKWYGENLPPLKAAFERDEITVPQDADSINDFSVFIVDPEKNIPKTSRRKDKGTRGEQRHGDSAIACALAYAATKGASFGYRKVKTTRRRSAFKQYL